MTDEESTQMEVSVTAEWVVELPEDIDMDTDVRSNEEMESVIAEEIGVDVRDDVVEYEINCEHTVI